jgi:hypothetical protein
VNDNNGTEEIECGVGRDFKWQMTNVKLWGTKGIFTGGFGL